ncbi:hypothetical protein ABZX93_12140 [Streptomyces sp. NPDC006632]|uniref:hypothetical protein n=1 Tax=unclassified Streptomyces TaxID=2593676 RepID=UPI002E204673
MYKIRVHTLRTAAALTHAVRAATVLTYVALAVGIVWALGIDSEPAPHTGVLICMWTAAGSAVARAALLWIRRAYGSRTARLAAMPEDRLWKQGQDIRLVREILQGVPDGSEGWNKIRQLLANFALLAASLTAITLPGLPGQNSLPAALQRAGAEVTIATVTGQPEVVRKEYDDDRADLVVGYYSKLRVSVPGSADPLPAGPVRTSEPLKAGARMAVMWAPSKPALGAYAGPPAELKRLAQGKWEVDLFQGGIDGDIRGLTAMIFGVCMLPWVFIFALCIDDDDMLRELAWSPVTQTVSACVVLGSAYGYSAALSGLPPNGLQSFWQLGGWLLMAGLIFTPVIRLVKDN